MKADAFERLSAMTFLNVGTGVRNEALASWETVMTECWKIHRDSKMQWMGNRHFKEKKKGMERSTNWWRGDTLMLEITYNKGLLAAKMETDINKRQRNS